MWGYTIKITQSRTKGLFGYFKKSRKLVSEKIIEHSKVVGIQR
jgi:hypothetical protein